MNVCREYDTDPTVFDNGDYKFTSEFGYKEYRNSLLNTIGKKCCYCEKPIAEGEIEHFRPKAGYKTGRNSPLIQPGYYWLAYRWDNMLLSCDECNDQKRKGNLFPLRNEGSRATNRSIPISQEDPILIDPSKEDPNNHITFNLERPIGLDNRGNEVIEIFELKTRGDLVDERLGKIRNFSLAKKISQLRPGDFTQSEINEHKTYVKEYKDPKAPFSGMICENIKRGIL